MTYIPYFVEQLKNPHTIIAGITFACVTTASLVTDPYKIIEHLALSGV